MILAMVNPLDVPQHTFMETSLVTAMSDIWGIIECT